MRLALLIFSALIFLNSANAQDEIVYEYVEGEFTSIPDFDSLTITTTGTTDCFVLDVRERDDAFAIRYKTCLVIETEGWYSFYLTSDDGVRLTINDTVVAERDGLQGLGSTEGAIYLTVGLHDVCVEYFEYYDEEFLLVQWAADGGPVEELCGDDCEPPGGIDGGPPGGPPGEPECPDIRVGFTPRNQQDRKVTRRAPQKKVCLFSTVRNNGNASGDYRFRGTRSDRNFTIKYFDVRKGNLNVTAQVRRGGYLLEDIVPGEPALIKVQVNPKSRIKFWTKRLELNFRADATFEDCFDRVSACIIKKATKRRGRLADGLIMK